MFLMRVVFSGLSCHHARAVNTSLALPLIIPRFPYAIHNHQIKPNPRKPINKHTKRVFDIQSNALFEVQNSPRKKYAACTPLALSLEIFLRIFERYVCLYSQVIHFFMNLNIVISFVQTKTSHMLKL